MTYSLVCRRVYGPGDEMTWTTWHGGLAAARRAAADLRGACEVRGPDGFIEFYEDGVRWQVAVPPECGQ